MNICDKFNKLPFPDDCFNPLSKEDFQSGCNCNSWWNWQRGPQGLPGPPGPKGDPGVDMKLIEERQYTALSDAEKLKDGVLWVVYPDNFF